MDAMEIAKLFVAYKETHDKLKALEAEITAAVLEAGKSQAVAGVKATYYNASLDTDWEAACKAAGVSPEEIEPFSTTKTTVAWAKVAAAVGVSPDGFQAEKPARVTLKVE